MYVRCLDCKAQVFLPKHPHGLGYYHCEGKCRLQGVSFVFSHHTLHAGVRVPVWRGQDP